MADYLLDTNHASRILDGSEPVTTRIEAVAKAGHRFGISVTVLGELYFAAHASQRRVQNLQAIHATALLCCPIRADARATEDS